VADCVVRQSFPQNHPVLIIMMATLISR
jgi:hypothetical protein